MTVAYANHGRWANMAVSLQVYEAELDVLCEFAQIVGQLLDLDRALENALKALAKSLAVERAIIALLDPETGNLNLKASYGFRPAERKKGLCCLGEGVMDVIVGAGRPFVFLKRGKKLLFSDEISRRGIEREEIGFLGTPILIQRKTAGILIVNSLFSRGVSLEEDIRLLVILANFIAQFIDLNREARERERSIEMQGESLREELSKNYNHFTIVGNSSSILQLRLMVETVARTTTPVLLLGERGTGRTFAARLIHELSEHASGPFVKLHCAAMEESRADSELLSKFEKAEGGTILLDEIGKLPLALQGILLGLCRDRKSESQGTKKTRKTKTGARIIASAEKDPVEVVSAGSFREDLYYRLNAFPLHLPPLRERNEDIPPLAQMFLRKAARKHGVSLKLTAVGLKLLQDYSWPGNIHELENFIQCLAMVHKGPVVDPDTLATFLKNHSLLRIL